jgi:hypothetical protein
MNVGCAGELANPLLIAFRYGHNHLPPVFLIIVDLKASQS